MKRAVACPAREPIAAFTCPAFRVSTIKATPVVHWTMPIAWRGTGWLNAAYHARFREAMLHAAAREGLVCPTYCLMPDHIHLVWMRLHRRTDQLTGMKFLREHLGKALTPHRFQHQAHDHVLRQEQRKRQAFRRVCFYVIDNCRVAGLVERPADWPHAGAIVPGYPALHPLQNGFWPLFWRIYLGAREADAGDIQRPPLNEV
jgi:REP element-mobilizing transposase RayT